MELRPLYLLRFRYPDGWGVGLEGPLGREERHFYFAEGTCEGSIAGRFRGANHPRRRSDATFQMDLQGSIETDDAALIMLDYQGYGRVYRQERREIAGAPWRTRQVVGAAWHATEHEAYKWLNDAICVISGEVRTPDKENVLQAEVELVFQVAELVWSAPSD